MSKRKNRERAAAGMIFRDGRLVKREDWEEPQIPVFHEPALPIEAIADRGVIDPAAGVLSKEEIIAMIKPLADRGGVIVLDPNQGKVNIV